MSEEIPLSGGNINEGVVRIENTVRRHQNKNSRSVHALFDYLHERSFSKAPRYLGEDSKGREILSYFDGDANNAQLFWTNDTALCDAARLLRQLHDLTVGFPFSDYSWGQCHPDPDQHEVLCHHDFAPYNIICQNHKITGIIDFDLAGPGPRLRDIAYAAYWMVPLSFGAPEMIDLTEQDIAQSNRRLRLFCATYGVPADDNLLAMVSTVLHHMGNYENAITVLGHDAATYLKSEGHIDHWLREARLFDANKNRFATENALNS